MKNWGSISPYGKKKKKYAYIKSNGTTDSKEHPQDRYHCKTPSEVHWKAVASDTSVEYLISENKYKEKWYTQKMPTPQIEM